jgi:hypothetical protein
MLQASRSEAGLAAHGQLSSCPCPVYSQQGATCAYMADASYQNWILIEYPYRAAEHMYPDLLTVTVKVECSVNHDVAQPDVLASKQVSLLLSYGSAKQAG